MCILKLILLGILFQSNAAFSALDKAPPSFLSGNKTVVWADFKSAKYKLVFNTQTKQAHALSTIKFELKEEGHPIIESVNRPSSVILGKVVIDTLEVETPLKETKVRILDKHLSAGTYTVEISTPISKGVKFEDNSVSVGFFMSDMKERKFMERYLPSNLEYDQFKIDISVSVVGTQVEHRLFTNGRFVKNTNREFEVKYPDYYNSSSLYFHLVPKTKFKVKKKNFNSIDGREVPVTIYSNSKSINFLAMRKVRRILKSLEKDYGPWPHAQMILYSNGKFKGGMEYAGAAISGWFAIGHELQHAYFARAVLPQNGNAGWLDEGIASWRDYFHGSKKKVNFTGAGLAGNSPYLRTTSKSSYKQGRAFMSHINYVLKKKTNYCLKDFLKVYFSKRKFTTVSTENFISDLEEFSGLGFREKFEKHIFKGGDQVGEDVEDNPYHLILSDKELLEAI